MTDQHRDFDFQALWRQNLERYAPSKPESGSTSEPCDLSDQFDQKLADLLFTPLGASPTLAQVAQAKFLLQEEWQAWRRSLPQDHRPLEGATRHRCVDEAYQATYDRLHTMHLRLHPPVNLIANNDELTRSVGERPKTPKKPRQGRVLFSESE